MEGQLLRFFGSIIRNRSAQVGGDCSSLKQEAIELRQEFEEFKDYVRLFMCVSSDLYTCSGTPSVDVVRSHRGGNLNDCVRANTSARVN